MSNIPKGVSAEDVLAILAGRIMGSVVTITDLLTLGLIGDNFVYEFVLSDGTKLRLEIPRLSTFSTIYVRAAGSTADTDDGNYRIEVKSNGRLAIDRRVGGAWVTRAEFGGSLFTDILYASGVAGGLRYLDSANDREVEIVRVSPGGTLMTFGDEVLRALMVSSDDPQAVIPTGPISDEVINSASNESTSSTELKFRFTPTKSGRVTQFDINTGGIDNARLSMREVVLDVETYENVSAADYDGNFVTTPISSGEQSIVLEKAMRLRAGVEYEVTIQAKTAATFNGSTIGGSFVPFAEYKLQPVQFYDFATTKNLGNLINSLSGDQRISANSVRVDTGVAANLPKDPVVSDALRSLQNQIQSNRQAQAIARGSFDTFNDSFTINDTNAAINGGRVNIYAAKIDKTVTVTLPTTQQLATANIGYPYGIEFVHSAGTSRSLTNNLLRVDSGSSSAGDLIDTTNDGINRTRFTLFQDDIALFVKDSAESNYRVLLGAFDPIAEITRRGVFSFRQDIIINNIVNLSSELNGISVNQGDAFIVTNGGEYFGVTVTDGDVIVAKQDNPDLTTNSDDWVVFVGVSNGLNSDQMAFFENVERDGTRFDLSKNVFANESNVIQFNSVASGGLPITLPYFTSFQEGPTSRTVTFVNQDIQFSDLQGGTLSLGISFAANTQSGFLPELSNIQFNYGNGAHVFTFPLTGIDVQSGSANIDIQIPNVDYSTILNTNCSVTLNYQFRGNTFVGSFTIAGLVNTLNGTLRQSVSDLADTRVALGEQRVNTRIDQLAHEIDNDGSTLQEIRDRLSPYKTITVKTPDINARFLDSTGSDNFPSAISFMDQVSANNPRYTGSNVALFVAVIAPGSFVLKNITTNSETALVDSDPNVSLGESLSFNGQTYFVYRVNGLTTGHVYEVEIVSQEQVVAWQSDIDNLNQEVNKINSELEHALLNLDPEVVEVLENEVNVTQESNPNIVPTDYNRHLAGPTNTTQTVFYEPNANNPSGGLLNSRPLNENTGDQTGKKLAYFDQNHNFVNGDILLAWDGTTQRSLVEYRNGEFIGKVFVPAIPSGTSQQTVYPAPSNRVSGAGIWQTISTIEFVDNIPTVVASELFFNRNLPSSPTTLKVEYRGHANNNIFGANEIDISNVGGSQEVFGTFTLNDGSETVNVEVAWLPSQRIIRVRVTERVNQGLPTINDVQVILSFSETRTVPATPATVRDVVIGHVESNESHVFAVRPNGANSLVLISDGLEVDTQFPYTTLFSSNQSGHLVITTDNGIFLNYEDFDPIPTTVADLENHALLPQRGLFTTEFTHNTIFNLATQLTVLDSNGVERNVGDILSQLLGN